MTPVEERIDHAGAKRLAKNVLSKRVGTTPYETEHMRLARAYLDLLTEHSALVASEERLRDALNEKEYPCQ